jgi:hypothetical protein
MLKVKGKGVAHGETEDVDEAAENASNKSDAGEWAAEEQAEDVSGMVDSMMWGVLEVGVTRFVAADPLDCAKGDISDCGSV